MQRSGSAKDKYSDRRLVIMCLGNFVYLFYWFALCDFVCGKCFINELYLFSLAYLCRFNKAGQAETSAVLGLFTRALWIHLWWFVLQIYFRHLTFIWWVSREKTVCQKTVFPAMVFSMWNACSTRWAVTAPWTLVRALVWWETDGTPVSSKSCSWLWFHCFQISYSLRYCAYKN